LTVFSSLYIAGRRKTEKKRGQIGGGVNVGQHVG